MHVGPWRWFQPFSLLACHVAADAAPLCELAEGACGAGRLYARSALLRLVSPGAAAPVRTPPEPSPGEPLCPCPAAARRPSRQAPRAADSLATLADLQQLLTAHLSAYDPGLSCRPAISSTLTPPFDSTPLHPLATRPIPNLHPFHHVLPPPRPPRRPCPHQPTTL